MIIATATILGFSKAYLYGFGGLALTAGLTQAVIQDRQGKLAKGRLGKQKDLVDLIGKDGVVVSKDFQLSAKYSNEHVLVIGPSGCGKTDGIFSPTIEAIGTLDNVLIITDPKGELYDRYAKKLKKAGKEIYRFNLNNPEKSDKFDPLAFCYDETDVMELATNIVINGNMAIESTGKQSKDAEWLNYATPLLNAFLLLAWSGNFKQIHSSNEVIANCRPPITLPEILDFLYSADEETLSMTIKKSGYQPAIQQYRIYEKKLGAKGASASIDIVLGNAIKTLMTDKKLEKIMSGNSLDPTTIRKKSKAIFLQVPVKNSRYYLSFTSLFYKQLMDKLYVEEIEELKEAKQTFLLIDELANIGQIPGLSSFVSYCRFNKISLTAAVQSISQIKSIYGEQDTDTILTNLKTTVLFPGTKFDTELVSKLTGEEQIEIKGHTYKKDLLAPVEIRQMKTGYVAILTGNKPTFIQKSAYKPQEA